MTTFRRLLLVSLTAGALAISGFASAAAQTTGSAHHAKTTYGKLTVHITLADGTVWGKVAIKPLNKTCTKATCTYNKVKVGTKLTLTETPVNSTTWPFSNWSLNSKGKGSATKLKFTMGKSDKVTAVYILPGGTLTVNITSTGTVWGSVKIEPLGVTCNKSSCVYKNVTLAENLTLTETPTDESTWPFGGWSLNNVDKGTATSLSFSMAQSDKVSANYCDGTC